MSLRCKPGGRDWVSFSAFSTSATAKVYRYWFVCVCVCVSVWVWMSNGGAVQMLSSTYRNTQIPTHTQTYSGATNLKFGHCLGLFHLDGLGILSVVVMLCVCMFTWVDVCAGKVISFPLLVMLIIYIPTFTYTWKTYLRAFWRKSRISLISLGCVCVCMYV